MTIIPTTEATPTTDTPHPSQSRDTAIQSILEPTDNTDYVAETAEAMRMLEPASMQPVKYTLLMVTVIENREQLQHFLSQNVTLHISPIDGKTRAFTRVQE